MVLLLAWEALVKIRRVSETPTTTTSQKNIAIHLQFVLQYASNLYCSAFAAAELSGKGNTSVLPHLYRSAPPICIAVRFPFVSQYASHSYRNTFGNILVVVVTGMFPIKDQHGKHRPNSTRTPSTLLYMSVHVKRGGNRERGVFAFACQCIVSLRGQSFCQTGSPYKLSQCTNATSPDLVAGRRNCARQSHAIGGTVLAPRVAATSYCNPDSPRKCQYPLFEAPHCLNLPKTWGCKFGGGVGIK